MTTLDPGGPHVDGRDMLIAELEDRLTAAQGEIRRLRSDYEARGSVIESLKREVTQVSLVARRTMDENDKLKAELAAEKNRTAAAIARNARLWARLEAEETAHGRLRPVVEAAKALREAESASPYLGAPPELVDLIAAVDALDDEDASVELSPADFGHVTQGDLDGIAAVARYRGEDVSLPLDDEDAADGAGTGEQVRWRDEWRVSTLGHYRRAATERHSWSDEKTFEGAITTYRLCLAEGTLTEPISWREPWIEHRRTAETAWQRIEPAASPAGSSTADEGDGRG